MIVSIADSAKESVKDKQESAKPALKVSRNRGKLEISVAKKPNKPATPEVRRGTKTAKILQMLQRPQGASLDELTRATKWQTHSVRGFLSAAIKVKMHLKLTSTKRDDGQRAYRVPSK